MTLRDARTISEGRFIATTLAGYERGERSISVERFCELARFYGIAPERLLADILRRAEDRPTPTIDLTRIEELSQEARDTVGGFAHEVRRLRGSDEEEMLTLRIGDLEVLATVSGHKLAEFLEHLRPALLASDEREG